MKKFYVYQYEREDGTPYYIGKGTGNRINDPKHTVSIPPEKERRVILFENLTDAESIEKEKELIAHYGRKDLGTGILRNLTDGGEGVSGRIFSHSEESKKKMSESHKGKKSPFKGVTGRYSEESLRKMSEAKKGKKQDPEVYAKRGLAISKAKKGVKNPALSKSKMGVKLSEEHRKAISDAHKKRWEKIKAERL